MAKIVKVAMDDEQFNILFSMLSGWEENPKLCGLITIEEIPPGNENEEMDIQIVFLKVSGEITYDLWNKFCQEIDMNIGFPNW
jgi:hypothetical protein